MLTFRSTSLVFIFVLVILTFISMFSNIPLVVFIFLSLIYSLIVIRGSYSVQSQFFMPVLCKGNEATPAVALTFDDGPSESFTPDILDILKKNEIKAAFFCIGEKVEANPELFKRISDEGHLIGNHSYSHHFFFDFFSKTSMVKEMRAMNKISQKITNKRITLFRPPYGVTTPVLAKAVKDARMIAVGWSLRSMDTTIKDSKTLVQKITKSVKAGDVILLHDTSASTTKSLQQVIDNIREKDLEIVRMDQLLNISSYG